MREKNIAYIEPVDYFREEIRKKYKLGEFAEHEESRHLKAVMLGHSVGDALGVPVEFSTREERNLDPVTDMRGWGVHSVPEGSWSDDTAMALATLDSLKDGEINYEDIMRRFVRWYSDGEYTATGEVFDIGCTTLSAIRNYMRGDKAALECGLCDECSNGNGSLMRIHPISLYLYFKGGGESESIEIIHNVSALTHAHPRATVACGIYSLVLWELLKGSGKVSVQRALDRARLVYGAHTTDGEIKRMIKRISDMARCTVDCDNTDLFLLDEIKSTGYVIDTLETAIYCLLTTNSYKECVLKTVNLGDDTDTLAAVAGGLAGALYGYEAIPKEWLGKLKRLDYIEGLCDLAYKKWKS